MPRIEEVKPSPSSTANPVSIHDLDIVTDKAEELNSCKESAAETSVRGKIVLPKFAAHVLENVKNFRKRLKKEEESHKTRGPRDCNRTGRGIDRLKTHICDLNLLAAFGSDSNDQTRTQNQDATESLFYDKSGDLALDAINTQITKLDNELGDLDDRFAVSSSD